MISLARNGTRTLTQLHQSIGFHHVIAMWAVPAGYLAMRLKQRCGVSYTTWCLGSDIWTYGRYPIFRNAVGRILRESAQVFADGIDLADRAKKLSGVGCEFLPSSRTPARSEKSSEGKGRHPRFIFVGRYASVKGVDVLLDAMSLFVRRGNSGDLFMYGGGPLDAQIRNRCQDSELQGRVNVHGYVGPEAMATAICNGDFVVIPSRMESIPLIFSDALSLGKPLIATDVGDMGLLLRKYPAGLVVPSEDPLKLCLAMEEATRSPLDRWATSVQDLASIFNLQRTTQTLVNRISGSSHA